MSIFSSKFKGKKSGAETGSSDFSVFFRTASAGEKKKVFMEVARKASADQRRVLGV